MGQIPVAPGRTRQRILKYLIDKPASAVAEAYRSLRTTVMMLNVDHPPQVILNTSCVPGEGKTTNSLGLAHNLMGMGKKVLLVEGDIRRRTLDNYFPDMPDKLGLISAMEGKVSLEEAVYLDPASGLYVLSGEATHTNAADVFSSDAFRDLLAQLRTTYDAVVIDCPPVLVVPDARIMAPHADAVLFTVRWDSTSEYEIEEALRIFHSSGQRISGFILGQIDLQRMKNYGSHGQYSAYSNYGSSYYHN